MIGTRISSLWGWIALIVIVGYSLSAYGKYGGGSGTPEDPYQIWDANHMQAIGADANDWDKCFILMADIDLGEFSGDEFNIIGEFIDYFDPNNKPFTGVFDGNDHTISNFIYDSNGMAYIGLFRYLDGPNAEIKNLGLIDPNVDAGTGYQVGSLAGLFFGGNITNCYVERGSVAGVYYVGGLVGYTSRGTITNCYSTASVDGIDYTVGGLVGENEGTISNCHSGASVHGSINVGGLVGTNLYGTITECYSNASVSGEFAIGGFVGVSEESTITECYSKASVSGDYVIGGLVGVNVESTITNCDSSGDVSGRKALGGLTGLNEGTIENCYATGRVDGDDNLGGLVGEFLGGIIRNCYSTGSVMGDENVGGLVGESKYEGNVSNCYSTGDVNGVSYVGGLVGWNGDLYWPGGTISICYSTGDVSGVWYVGGLVGIQGKQGGNISNCYSIGDVNGYGIVGGLLGQNEGGVSTCYSTGDLNGDYQAGGLVGWNNDTISYSYWDILTSGEPNMCGTEVDATGCDPNYGKTTAEMQIQSTFTNWDFTNIWDICEGTNYPRFLWQIPIGDFLCPDGVNFFDYSFFAGHWQHDNCGASNDCDRTDLNLLGTVENNDLRIFVDNWLRGF
jgi:hypothetical protein